MADELVALGHRRIGAIFGPRNTSTATERESALRDALDAHGVTIPSAYTYRGPFDFATGATGSVSTSESSSSSGDEASASGDTID